MQHAMAPPLLQHMVSLAKHGASSGMIQWGMPHVQAHAAHASAMHHVPFSCPQPLSNTANPWIGPFTYFSCLSLSIQSCTTDLTLTAARSFPALRCRCAPRPALHRPQLSQPQHPLAVQALMEAAGHGLLTGCCQALHNPAQPAHCLKAWVAPAHVVAPRPPAFLHATSVHKARSI